MSTRDDSSTDGADNSGGGQAAAKLTVSQRVLAALPNLQREPGAARPARTPRPSRPTGRSTESADGAVVTPDEVLAPGTDATAGRTGAATTAPVGARRAPSGMTPEQLVERIKRIDDRERAIALGTAVIGVAVGIAVTLAYVHTNPPLHAKNHQSAGVLWGYGIARVVLSGLVAVAAQYRRRSFVGFALLILGTSMASFLFVLPFWIAGGWLIFRALKWQRELAALTGNSSRSRSSGRTATARTTTARASTTPAARGREAAEARRKARMERVNARTAGGRRSKKQPEPAGPSANKRYTPPGSTTRPRPPIV